MMIPLVLVLVLGLFLVAERTGGAQEKRRSGAPRSEVTREERIEAIKELYVAGEIDLQEFERRAKAIYEGSSDVSDYSDLPNSPQQSRQGIQRSDQDGSVLTPERRGRGCRR
jgi:hypothetical protein